MTEVVADRVEFLGKGEQQQGGGLDMSPSEGRPSGIDPAPFGFDDLNDIPF